MERINTASIPIRLRVGNFAFRWLFFCIYDSNLILKLTISLGLSFESTFFMHLISTQINILLRLSLTKLGWGNKLNEIFFVLPHYSLLNNFICVVHFISDIKVLSYCFIWHNNWLDLFPFPRLILFDLIYCLVEKQI